MVRGRGLELEKGVNIFEQVPVGVTLDRHTRLKTLPSRNFVAGR